MTVTMFAGFAPEVTLRNDLLAEQLPARLWQARVTKNLDVGLYIPRLDP
ncbi:MAG: hypothetical protein HY663_07330 [Chloroflexi bacterium]|nr:hypothetical protein [Chloroflexota bacterium]